MKKFTLLFVLCSLVGCATQETRPAVIMPFSVNFTALEKSERVVSKGTYVRWEAVDDVDATCRMISRKLNRASSNIAIVGCADWNIFTGQCVIYTNKKTSHEVLGHEIRHCFEGAFHK